MKEKVIFAAIFAAFSAVLFAVILTGFASALSSINYQIFDEKVLVEMNFDRMQNIEVKIPSDSSAIELNTENYKLSDFEEYKLIKVSYASNVIIKYITSAYIDKSGSRYFFVSRNSKGFSNVSLFLPEGALLSRSEDYLVIPEPNDIDSDGRRVILKWNDFGDEEIVVSYEFVKNNSALWYVVLLIILAVLIYYFYGKMKNKKFAVKRKFSKRGKSSKNLTTNLYGDEKRIVEYLAGKKGRESWTKEIVRDLEISKVKLSRKLRNLEQLELIKRIPYGNENRIKLLKK